jgi:hypothetical protein
MGRQVLFEEADVQAETLDMSLADHLRQGDVLNRRPDSDDLDAAPTHSGQQSMARIRQEQISRRDAQQIRSLSVMAMTSTS